MPQSLAFIKQLLSERGLSPQKMFGQNFLVDHNLIRKLADAACLKPDDVVLEIGPGTGTLTEELLTRGCHVIACDIDRGLCQLLRDTVPHLPGSDRFTLVEGDCLAGKHALSDSIVRALARHDITPTAGRFMLVSNLPYACATPVMMILLAQWRSCAGLFVTIQKEVGERLAAQPSTKDYGPLTILAQSVGSVEWIAKLPPQCFWPQPDVTSAMLALRRHSHPLTTDAPGLLALATKLFENRRKQLGPLLVAATSAPSAHLPMLLPAGVEPAARAESLTVAQWNALHALAVSYRVSSSR